MKGDFHVRFCGRLGVRFPLPTRQCATKMKISVAEMPEGVYFIKIDSEYGSVTEKIIFR